MKSGLRFAVALTLALVLCAFSLCALAQQEDTDFTGVIARHFLMLPDGTYPSEPNETERQLTQPEQRVSASGFIRDDFTGYVLDRCQPTGLVEGAAGGAPVDIYYKANEHLVSYDLTGAVPPDVTAPQAAAHRFGAALAVEPPPAAAGYAFSGWSTEDTVVENGQFVMPDGNVRFTGYFAPQSYTLSYQLTGDVPEGAVAPDGAAYLYGERASVAPPPLVPAGYDFSGWTAQVAMEDGALRMPAADVVLIGQYTHIRYSVTWTYEGGAPDGAAVPDTAYFHYGDALALPAPSAAGWAFLGWVDAQGNAVADGTAMPDGDIALAGRWLDLRGWSVTGIDAVYDGTPHTLALSAPGMPQDSVAELSLDDGQSWLPLSTPITDATSAMAQVRVTYAGGLLCTMRASVLIAPRVVTVRAPSGELVYNGELQTLPMELDARADGLAPGDRLASVTLGSYDAGKRQRDDNVRQDAGAWPVRVAAVAIDREGRDVTGNYAVTLADGTFTILPFEAQVSLNSTEVLYSGKSYAFDPKVQALGLNGRKLKLQARYVYNGAEYASVKELPSVTDAGRHTLTVYLSEESGNLSFAPEGYTAVLNILPIPLVAALRAQSFVYDGNPHGLTELTLAPDGDSVPVGGREVKNPGLLRGHQALAAEVSVRTLPGEYSGIEAGGLVITQDGADVTHNYAIRREPSTISISCRPVTVEVGSAQKVYDGQPLTVSWKLRDVGEPDTGLLDGHRLSGILAGATLCQAGQSVASVRGYIVEDESGADITDRYRVTVLPGSVTVLPRPVRLHIVSQSRMYDGQPLCAFWELEPAAQDSGLAVGDTAQPVLSGDGLTNVGTNTVTLAVFTVTAPDGTDVSASYQAQADSGTLSVTPRPIRVLVGMAQKTFDGLPLAADWAVDALTDEGNAGLAAGDRAAVALERAQRDSIGSNEVHLQALSIAAASGEDRTGNYALTSVDGRLTIKPIGTSYTVRYIYDGEIAPRETLTFSGSVGDMVRAYPPKPRPGMRLDYVSGLPLVLGRGDGEHVIDVFYLTSPKAAPDAATGDAAPIAGDCAE